MLLFVYQARFNGNWKHVLLVSRDKLMLKRVLPYNFRDLYFLSVMHFYILNAECISCSTQFCFVYSLNFKHVVGPLIYICKIKQLPIYPT